MEEAGGAVVADEGADGGPLVAAFHVAADAALAAVRVAAALDATGRPRMVLATGEVEATPAGYRGRARERADALARLDEATGEDAVALLAASAAVMVTHALPPGADLVDRGPVPLAGPVAERVYELRWSARDPAGDDGAAVSNLGWARRAAARLVVGRDEQVSRLEAAWQAALAGERRVVVVAGDPGIGKTTVAAELALRVHAGGATVLYGRWDEEGLAPYQALREALGSYATACPRPRLRADVAQHAGELARLLPDIAARIGGAPPPLADDPDAERLRLFDAVRDWLGAITGRGPVLLVLDDLQWADRSSLLLLRHVLDSPPAGPLLVVVTMRDGDVEGIGPLHRVASLEEAGALDRIEVPGLGPDDVRQLVGQALGRPVGEGESEVTAWLASETAGNPLFLHEILRGLDPADPAAALQAARDRLPERIHDVVRWRLSGLSPRWRTRWPRPRSSARSSPWTCWPPRSACASWTCAIASTTPPAPGWSGRWATAATPPSPTRSSGALSRTMWARPRPPPSTGASPRRWWPGTVRRPPRSRTTTCSRPAPRPRRSRCAGPGPRPTRPASRPPSRARCGS